MFLVDATGWVTFADVFPESVYSTSYVSDWKMTGTLMIVISIQTSVATRRSQVFSRHGLEIGDLGRRHNGGPYRRNKFTSLENALRHHHSTKWSAQSQSQFASKRSVPLSSSISVLHHVRHILTGYICSGNGCFMRSKSNTTDMIYSVNLVFFLRVRAAIVFTGRRVD